MTFREKPSVAVFGEQDQGAVPADVMRTMMRTLVQETIQQEFDAFLGAGRFERDPHTGTYVGFVPGFPGAHSQGESLDELQANLQEVTAMLLEDGETTLEAEFIGTQTIRVA